MAVEYTKAFYTFMGEVYVGVMQADDNQVNIGEAVKLYEEGKTVEEIIERYKASRDLQQLITERFKEYIQDLEV